MNRAHLSRLSGLVVVLALHGCGASATPAEMSATASDRSREPSILVTPELGHPHIGDLAPEFELTDQDGKRVTLSSLRGSVVALALVSSWCPYSKAAQPHLAELARAYASKGVRTVAVVVADTPEGYQKYLGRTPMPFPVMFDASDEVAAAYAPPNAQPSFKDRRKVVVSAQLVLDSEGRIRFYTLVDTTQFDAELTHLRQALDDALASGPST